MNLNLIIGIIGILLGGVFILAWRKTRKTLNDLISKIQSKPKIEFTPQVTNVGEIKGKDIKEAPT